MGIQPAGPPSGNIALMDTKRHSFEYEDLLACGRGELFGPGNDSQAGPRERLTHAALREDLTAPVRRL